MGTAATAVRPPFHPFTGDSAIQKVRLVEDAWNTRDPAKVALAYAIDSRWRNRSEFIEKRLSTNSRASLNVRSRAFTTAR
jgi:nuclear transport factor 2 (NTF2) superfamily protein